MLVGLRLVSEAADFAARRHTGQQRKGRGNEPYVNHLAEVASLLSIATDGTDAESIVDAARAAAARARDAGRGSLEATPG